VLFSEPKIPQLFNRAARAQSELVSVLFSEPKIPQSFRRLQAVRVAVLRFSALQRAENSSIEIERREGGWRVGFSALQRAENSSIPSRERHGAGVNAVSVLFSEPKIPQSLSQHLLLFYLYGFSALQRAENSSIAMLR